VNPSSPFNEKASRYSSRMEISLFLWPGVSTDVFWTNSFRTSGNLVGNSSCSATVDRTCKSAVDCDSEYCGSSGYFGMTEHSATAVTRASCRGRVVLFRRRIGISSARPSVDARAIMVDLDRTRIMVDLDRERVYRAEGRSPDKGTIWYVQAPRPGQMNAARTTSCRGPTWTTSVVRMVRTSLRDSVDGEDPQQ